VAGLVAAATILGGCLGEPEIEDRWTRIDVVSTSLAPGQAVPSAGPFPISVRSKITYRSILTGFAVTDLRASATVSNAALHLHPDAPREAMAAEIDYLLQNSVSVGRATRAITGWDHLIQEIDFNFSGWVPGTLDSAGTPIGAPVGLFLVSYLGSGEEVEIGIGMDSLIVTPFPSGPYEILPVGLELLPPGGTP
jgi:hypothetical protein